MQCMLRYLNDGLSQIKPSIFSVIQVLFNCAVLLIKNKESSPVYFVIFDCKTD